MTPAIIGIIPKSHAITDRAWRRALLLAPLALFACTDQPPPPGSTDTLDAEESGAPNNADTEESGDGTYEEDTNDDDTTTTTTDSGSTEDDTSDTNDTGPTEFDDTLYPLVDGANWTYLIKNTNGQVLGMDVVDATEIEWDNDRAWLLTDHPNAQGEWTESTIVSDGTLSTRVHKEILTDAGVIMIVDYDPGFARVDDAWTELGFSDELLYERVETDGDGNNAKIEPRGHTFTVLDDSDVITVPAGTFDCVKIRRVRSVGTNAGEVVVSWYAFGVGKIREERPAESKVEELASVSLPGGVHLP